MTILLILTIALFIINYFLYKYIHQFNYYLYGIAIILGAISLTLEVTIINLGFVGFSFFILVMYSGAFDKGKMKKSLLATRAEMAILGTIFITVHGIKFILYVYDFGNLFAAPLYFYIGIVALLFAAPLFITSFMFIRKKMNGKSWKRLHRLAYVFYFLVAVHLILIQIDRINFEPSTSKMALYEYIGIFGLYFILRIWTWFDNKKMKKKKTTKKLAV